MSVPAGASARAMFKSFRRSRRRRLAWGIGLLIAAIGLAGWDAVVTASSGPSWIYRSIAVVACAAGLVALLSLVAPRWRDLERWERGALGEQLTAARLDRLPPKRWAVWHDLRVPGSRANIDHVAVGRTGVWVIDTKTTRRPIRTGWRSVHLGDRRLATENTWWEAEVVADRLAARLGETLPRPLPVRPIVALHGSGLSRRGGRAGGIRVVRPDELVRSMRRGRRRLARSEVRLVWDAVDRAFPTAGEM